MSLRVFVEVPQPNELVLSRGQGLERRAYLDGLPISSAKLEWWSAAPNRAGRWVPVRVFFRGGSGSDDLTVIIATDEGEELEAREEHRFRWPARKHRAKAEKRAGGEAS